jgi:hypothetical protein
MNFNLSEIRLELSNNVEDHFKSSSNPRISSFSAGFSFEKGLDLFFKAIVHRTGNNELDGLTKTMIPALYDAYVAKRGELTPLKILSTELEAYLKKLCFVVSSGVDNFSNDKSKTLLPLYNHLALHPSKPYISADCTEAKLPNYIGSSHFQQYLVRAYIVRNAVHKSPNWKLSEIAHNLDSIMIAFLYPTFQHFSALDARVGSISLPTKPEEPATSNPFIDKQALYDFMSHNSGTSQIRNQIVTSFILHTISSLGGASSLKQLQATCNAHFNTNADISFYSSIVEDLAKPEIAKVTISGVLDDQISLSDAEKKRIERVKNDLSYQEQFFQLEVSEILKAYHLESHTQKVVKNLTALFEANYNIDLKEMLDQGIEATDNSLALKVVIDYIKSLLPREVAHEPLLRDLIQVCNGNDFLGRITAGHVFAKISNLPQIQDYINQKGRIVYLDTNVLLYVMCYFYEDDQEYKSIYYQTVRQLFKYTSTHKNLLLKTTTNYVEEVAYHMKEALLLIPFEDIGLFQRLGSTNNVFYKFYVHLRDCGNLDNDVQSFGRFMAGFQLYEDDVDDTNFFRTAAILLTEFLEELGIEVIQFPFYPNKDEVFEIVKNALTVTGKAKDPTPLLNDTLMVCHLGDKAFHDIDPTFVTWDSSFYGIRKRYVARYRNGQLWHLFTPNKFLNHLQLLEFKIDASNVTSDFLTIIDGISLSEKTKNMLDLVGQLLDIEKEERRRYMTKFKEFSMKYVYNIEDASSTEAEEIKLDFKPLEKVIAELFRYFNDQKNNRRFSDLKLLFANKEFFDEVVIVFQKALENYLKDKTVPKEALQSFEELAKKAKAAKS